MSVFHSAGSTSCEDDVNPCYSNHCMNGATCQNIGTNFTCTCLDIYVGVRCEQHVCQAQSPCLNGGVCVYDGSCVCPPEYTGPNCETDVCAGIICQHGGVCQEGHCQCHSGFTGILQKLFYSV